MNFICVVAALMVAVYSAGVVESVPSPIVMIPGLTGSRLDVQDSRWGRCNTRGQKYELWVNESRFISRTGCVRSELMMNYDAESERYYDQAGVTVTARGFGQTEAAEFVAVNDIFQMAILHKLVDYFVHRGYVRGKSIRAATYDWRRGAGGLEEKGYYKDLKNLIEKMYYENGNTKVTMVGHSLGAPVSLHFLTATVDQAWKDKYIHAYATIGGAWAGATKSLGMIITGLISFADTDNGPGVIKLEKFINAIVGPIFRSFESVYWMLPRASVVGPDTVVVTTHEKKYTANDYEELFEDLGYPEGYQRFQGIERYNVDWPAPNVPMYCFYGLGIDTASAIVYGEGDFPEKGPVSLYGDGDGTVYRSSLEVCKRWGNGNNGGHPFTARVLPNAEHVSIAYDERFLREFAEIAGAPKEPIGRCQLPADPGPCDNVNQRYFFNSTSAECEEFNYGGCHGNENNFQSVFGCILKCAICHPNCK